VNPVRPAGVRRQAMAAATIYLTNECNLRCKHCAVGHDQLRPRPLMTTAEIKAVIRNFATHGVRVVTFLGGEVTTGRSDLADILEYCGEVGIAASINTNLTEFDRLEPVLAIDALFNVVVSLDGLSAATHDRMRGKGSFAKTIRNLGQLCVHPRVLAKAVKVDVTFVLSAINKDDIFAIPEFYKRYNLNALNFKTLQYSDRALTNKSQLYLSEKELLDRCTAFYALCVLEGGMKVDMHIPPAFGHYLSKLLPTPEQLWNFASCGGTGVYTYVDLYGNNLPCPAMSFEENPDHSNLKGRMSALSAVENPISEIQSRSLFKGFDKSIAERHRNRNMHPCNVCIFSDRCSPCTSEVIRSTGQGRVDLCAAVFAHGDARVPGISGQLFHQSGVVAEPATVTA
jgi:MoaA/NifB/PqqE/SkfB family radical SAM enzyme